MKGDAQPPSRAGRGVGERSQAVFHLNQIWSLFLGSSGLGKTLSAQIGCLALAWGGGHRTSLLICKTGIIMIGVSAISMCSEGPGGASASKELLLLF
jgi:hypothetical protein